MTSLILTGLLTVIERCHNFDCKMLSRPNTKCQVTASLDKATPLGKDAGTGSILGHKFWHMQYFMRGSKTGYFGIAGRDTLSLFFIDKRWEGYFMEYAGSDEDYVKSKCEGALK